MSLEVDRLEAWLDDQEGIASRVMIRRFIVPIVIFAAGFPFVVRDSVVGLMLMGALATVVAIGCAYALAGWAQVPSQLANRVLVALLRDLSRYPTQDVISGLNQRGVHSRELTAYLLKSRAVGGDTTARAFLLNQPWSNHPLVDHEELSKAEAKLLLGCDQPVGGRHANFWSGLGLGGVAVATLGLLSGLINDIETLEAGAASSPVISPAIAQLMVGLGGIAFVLSYLGLALSVVSMPRPSRDLTALEQLAAWIDGKGHMVLPIKRGCTDSDPTVRAFMDRFLLPVRPRATFWRALWPLIRAEDRLPELN